MKPDKKLVGIFLRGCASETESRFVKIDWPDEAERKKQAVDAIATDPRGRRVAVEHTILQPFPRQKEKLHGALAKVFEPLAKKTVPGRHLWVQVPEDSVGPGQDWKKAAAAVKRWFTGAKASFPEGWSEHIVPGLPSQVRMHVLCQIIKGHPGGTAITYVHTEMEKHFITAVRESLAKKLEELAKAKADKRILLFQKEWRVYSSYELGRALESVEGDFPELGKVDEVWLADTSLCFTGGRVWFNGVWPRGSLSHLAFWAECP